MTKKASSKSKDEEEWVPRCPKCGQPRRQVVLSKRLGGAVQRIGYRCGCEPKKPRKYRTKNYKEPVGFFKDEKGRDVAVDKKGRKFDPEESRYNLERDPHGWKATGKSKPRRSYH